MTDKKLKLDKQKQLQHQRLIYTNERQQNQQQKYSENLINTQKYTWWNFLPKSILLQFLRAANMYFLISAIVISIDQISPLSPITAIGPLILVLATSMVREAMEEHKRIQNDKQVNQQKTLVLNKHGKFKQFLWKHLQVGDIVKVYKNEMFPADLFLITSSDDENGMAFVETANLDGERNLKPKSSQEKIHKIVQRDNGDLNGFQSKIICDKPNNNIHQFRGSLYLSTQPKQNENQIKNQKQQNPSEDKKKNVNITYGDKIEYQEEISLTNDNCLLRGTILKNTEWVIGSILYAGKDSKIMQNQGSVRIKITKIEKTMNYLIIGTFFLQQFVQGLISGFSYADRETEYPDHPDYQNHSYLEPQGEDTYKPFSTAMMTYAAFFILLNTFIPISLIISLEVVKAFQAAWIEYDENMVYKELNFQPRVLNTLIHEQLGEIEYLFTDKTGTLTSNNMVFTGCCIDKFEFTNKELIHYFKKHFQKILNAQSHKQFLDFMLCLVLAHDCIKDEGEPKVDKNNVKELFQGSSPDEVCLVQVAYDLGFKFVKRTQNAIFIQIGEENKIYEFLLRIEFSSDRKRMSVVVKDPDTQKVILYSKGADSYIMKSLYNKNEKDQLQILVKDSLQTFSQDGLRTLCLAKKEIDYEDFKEWYSEYQQSVQNQITDELMNIVDITQIKSKAREELKSYPKLWQYKDEDKDIWVYFDPDVQEAIDEAFQKQKPGIDLEEDQEILFNHETNKPVLISENHQNQQRVRKIRTIEFLENYLEGDLDLLGATAVEDKLQDGVPETLLDLQKAGIKVWMLTGDKLETAQNIGYLCNLVTKQSKIYLLNSDSKADTLKSLEKINIKLQTLKQKQLNELEDKKLSTKKRRETVHQLNQEQYLQQSKHIIEGKKHQNIENSKTYKVMEKNDNVEKQVELDYINQSMASKNYPNQNVDPSADHGMSIDLFSRVSRHYQDAPVFYEKFDLIIEGKCINHILNSKDSQEEFLKLIPEVSTVICYRSTPTQKAQVVKFVKSNLKKITLAIGDGGNDVNMIQEADIGVGIIGKEGNQAALASDYYFGQFRFLWRLLFVHGRNNVKRTAYFINYFFYKNIVFTLQQVFFAFFSKFSAQTFWEDGYLLNFNSIVTAVAPVWYAIFDKDVNPLYSKEIHESMPLLYSETRSSSLFNVKTFLKWVFFGIFHAFVIFFMSVQSYAGAIIQHEGQPDDLWAVSVNAYFSTVYVVLGVLVLDTKEFNIGTFFGYGILSFFLFFPIFTFIWSYTTSSFISYAHLEHIGNFRFWFTIIITTFIPLVIQLLLDFLHKVLKPTLAYKMQIRQKEILSKVKNTLQMKLYIPTYGEDGLEKDEQVKEIKQIQTQDSKEIKHIDKNINKIQKINQKDQPIKDSNFKQFQKSSQHFEANPKSPPQVQGMDIDIDKMQQVEELKISLQTHNKIKNYHHKASCQSDGNVEDMNEIQQDNQNFNQLTNQQIPIPQSADKISEADVEVKIVEQDKIQNIYKSGSYQIKKN